MRCCAAFRVWHRVGGTDYCSQLSKNKEIKNEFLISAESLWSAIRRSCWRLAGAVKRGPKKLNGTWVLGLAAPAQLLCLDSWLRAQLLPGSKII